MTPLEFATIIRYKTNTDATSLTDTQILALANANLSSISNKIVNANEDHLGMIYRADLVADQRQYQIPSNLIKIKRLEIKIDNINWKVAKEFDLNLYEKTTDEATIQANFSDNKPLFEMFSRSFFIYSSSAIIDVTDGLKLWTIVYPANLTNVTGSIDMSEDPSSTTLGFPKQFHELLSRKVIIDYKANRDNPMPLTESERRYDMDLEDAIDAISNFNQDKSFVLDIPSETGENF